MWNAQRDRINDRVHKYQLRASGQPLSYAAVVDLWQQADFQRFFTELLADAPFAAYFWETPPVTTATRAQPFECVLTESEQLAKIAPDPSDFSEHFRAAAGAIATFESLGKDALLVTPCPQGSGKGYAHLGAFMRSDAAAQQAALWQAVSQAVQSQLNQRPLWLSTSGLGVSWLHVRLDSRPKYYSYRPYRDRSA
ncbi:MAG: hypothetical protein F6J97_12385 [Leptolyngbya sp. SIO4C1]|nr:hypothetical protein [Leptolyngbya sp. SIO4C1]